MTVNKRTSPGSELRRLIDVRAVEDLLLKYGNAIDRVNPSELASCFHPDAVMHYPFYTPDQGDYISWVLKGIHRFAGRKHYLSNLRIEVDGDVAWAESYLHAYHWGDPPTDSTLNFDGGSRYVDRLERRDGDWKIAERTVVRSFRENNTDGLFAAYSADPPTAG